MYYIYFANTVIFDATNTGQCCATEYTDALAVCDALSATFLVVDLYDEDGNKLWAYCNL